MSNFNNPKPVKDKTSYGPLTLIFFVILPVGLVIFLLGNVLFGDKYSEYILNQRGQQATATVLEARCDHYKGTPACYLKVSLYDAQSRSVTAKVGTSPTFVSMTSAGASVPVIYDPQKPERARLGIPEYAKPYWYYVSQQLGVALGALAIIMLGIMVWVKFKRYYRK